MKSLLLVTMIFVFSNVVYAQIDTLQVAQPDSTMLDEKEDGGKTKKKKGKNEFKVFAGVNLNDLSVSSEQYESIMGIGYQLGASYKQGKFFYWELGFRLNNPVYNLSEISSVPDSSINFDGIFGVRNIDIPLTVGINLLSVTSRLVGLLVFVSAVPAFVVNVGDNDLGISKDNINSFNLYGQGGLGVDVAFLFLDTGFNYGFNDLLQHDIKSNPYQIFVNLGFRF